jgi:hypothetical protein
MGVKVSISVSLFPINLMGKSTIGLMRDKNIKKRKRVISLNFHGKLDLRGNVVKI